MYFNTPLLRVVNLPADNNHKGGFEPRKIEAIFLHSTVGTNSKAWLTTTPNSNASVHRLIEKDGTIYKCVDDNIAAWTQGPATWYYPPHVKCNPNQIGLSIEFENLNDGHDPYPLAQVDAGARQCVEWWGKYGFIPILQHRMLQENKSDPYGFPWTRFNSLMWSHLSAIALHGAWAGVLV